MTASPERELQPLFLLSLPRSGSTLLQRMLANSPQISTAAEPWVLLPLVDRFLVEDPAVYGAYDHETARLATREFVERFPRGHADLEREIANFIRAMYAHASEPGATYFLDKTPRYAAYADLVTALFPNAPVVVLTRDLRSVMSSIIRTWGRGHWNVFLYLNDLVEGQANLLKYSEINAPNVCAIDYDELVRDPQTVARRLEEFLGVTITGDLLPADDPKLLGSMGDRMSSGRTENVVNRGRVAWDAEFSGVVRRWWLRRYLRRAEPAFVRGAGSVSLVGKQFRLVDRWSDLLLVPITLVWRPLNAATGFRLEALVRRRLSTAVRDHYGAYPRPSRARNTRDPWRSSGAFAGPEPTQDAASNV